MHDARAAIEAQMQLYFDGLHHSDTDRLRQVFDPAARYVCATDDEIVNLGMTEYFPIVEARQPPAARGEARRDEIVSIAFAGPRTAFVQAHCAIGARYFTDFLTFIRTADGWRIVAKVFHHEPIGRPAAPNKE
ncbi:MAG: nuclear transport factor 2 family protein [Inquilinaceae bacterium]